jgi:adenine-specific DNA-methyltransferase
MGHIPPVHDFITAYAKDQLQLCLPGIPQSEEFLARTYSNPDSDPRGAWTTSDLSANHKGPYFEIVNPVTMQVHLPPKGRYWVFNKEEIERRIADGRIIFGKSGKAAPVQRVFMKDRITRQKPETWFDAQGYNSDGMQILSEIMGGKVLDHPKPPSLIEYILTFFTTPSDIVLDSFAGSGTTAHAVLNLNHRDGGNRKFILVECEDYAESITAERVRRVIDGYGGTPGTGGGFAFCELGERLLLEDGNLNEMLNVEQIREYIWHTETKTAYSPSGIPYYLGEAFHTAYWFYYERFDTTTLDVDFLRQLNKEERYVIYADICALSAADLNRWSIKFKKIPRDIRKLLGD